MRESIIAGAAGFGVCLCIGTIGLGLWLIVRERRWILGAIALTGSFTALVAGLLACTQHWFSGLAVIDLDLGQLAGNLVMDWLAIACSLFVLLIAFRFLRSQRSSHAIYAICILFLAMQLAGTILISQSQTEGYSIEGDSAIPITEWRDPAGLRIVLPDGFAVRTVISGAIGHPSALCLAPDSTLFISDVEGRIWYTRADANRMYAEPALLIDGLSAPVGLAWHEDELYVSSVGRIDALRLGPGYQVLENRSVVTGIPAHLYVFHQNNQIVFGPDGRGYVGVGSTSDAAPETIPFAASIVSFDPAGGDLRVVATGLRNPYGIAFDKNGQLWATDNGPATRFTPEPREELNAIEEGKHYGFPEAYGSWIPESAGEAPVTTFPPHSSADGLLVYPDEANLDFPSEYAGNMFVAAWSIGVIYRVRVHEIDGIYLQKTSVFATGFANPLAFAIDSRGRLLIADYSSQSIFEIAFDAQ